MSHAPYYPPGNQPHSQPTNGLGIAGFIVSLVGLILTCGLLSPLGLLLSLFALFKPPRGFAVAGVITGLVGTAMLALFGFYMVMGAKGVGEAARAAAKIAQTMAAIGQAQAIIEQHRAETSELPEGIEGNKLVIGIQDGWQHSLRYDRMNGDYLIRSAGADGEFETADDLTSNQSFQPAAEKSDDVPDAIDPFD